MRYVEPDAETRQEKKGFLAKLAFWRSDKPAAASAKFQVRVAGEGEATQVSVRDEQGRPAPGSTGERIVKLLYEQLK